MGASGFGGFNMWSWLFVVSCASKGSTWDGGAFLDGDGINKSWRME